MQEIEDRVSIPFHGKTTKVSPADVIRGWLALQSGLAESSKKTVLGSTDYDGDRKRDRDRKIARLRARRSRRVGAGDASE